MTRIPQQPPAVLPVAPGTERPRWSVMIPVYNSACFLKEALLSVLQQDPGAAEMQIEVVDDCSTDANIEELVNEVGKGRILYYRQPQNVGSVYNFATCLNRSKGMLVHLLHADDKVLPGFYTRLADLFKRFPAAGAACCNYACVDENSKFVYNNTREATQDGLLENFLLTMAERCPLQYVCIAVKREVYEKKGSFFGVVYGEDWEMWGRIAKDYEFAYTPEVLAEYRIHESNISTGSFRTGQNFKDISWVINTINSYLPETGRKKIKQKALKHYARYALGYTGYLWHVSRDKKSVYSQVAGALRMHIDAVMIMKAAKAYAKVWLHPLRKWIGNVKD